MVAKTYVQKAVLAGRTKLLAREHFVLDVHEGRYGHSHDVRAVRFPPQFRALPDGPTNRFRALVTWVPVRGELDGLGTA